MNQLIRILGRKLFALTVLIGIGVWFLVLPAFTGNLGANPLEKLLHQSGEIAIWILGAVLALTPLRVLFPHSRIVTALNRHRRAIGVAACIYGLIHFSFHILYEGGWEGLVRSLSKPFIWFGATGLFILVILAVTSNQFSTRVSQEELEAASSAGLRCGCAAHLSPGNCGKRPLGDCALVIVPSRDAPTSSFDKDSRARKAPKYCFAICCETGRTRY